jgi:hypothetical protein
MSIVVTGSAPALPLWRITIGSSGSGPISLANLTTGETATLAASASALTAPATPTLSSFTDPSALLPAGTYYVVLAYNDGVSDTSPISGESTGQTITSGQGVFVHGVDSSAQPSAVTVVLYASTTSGGPYYFAGAITAAGFGPSNVVALGPPSGWGGLLVPSGYTNGDVIEMNRDGYTVTLNGDPLFGLFDGTIPRLLPGVNDFLITAGGTATVGSVEVVYAPRYQ